MSRLPPQLPLEIFIDILSRLPVKPLLRFKSVCKSWRSLISNNPEFAKFHLERAKQDTSDSCHRLFLATFPLQSIDLQAYCDGDDSTATRELSYPLRSESELSFVGSCNGLIAAVLDSNPQIIVWNPSTGQSRELSMPSCCFPDDKLFSGFGYESHLDDYKVVRGSISASSSEVEMEVFNLKGNEWRRKTNLHCSAAFTGSATYLNGVLHWLVEEKYPNRRYLIVSFDLAEEKFLEMVTVPDHISQNSHLDLKVLRGFLCACNGTYDPYYEAWIMKGYGPEASWTRLFSFCSDPLPGCKYWLQVLWAAKNGNIVLDYEGWELVVFNPEEKTVKQFTVPNEWDCFEATTYIESLVSPNAAVEAGN
ncbi:F-box/kelch-repeat protein At3g06240 isoform X2 [Manihot esculenta]|uniref:F-box domain-containing protein n=1 Tax=Manihot esculenta TaxID=3983 RepID=A0A2C9WKN2_MANES|nr:F-box/kelch-repeat protein At3g06240 isoform X2 [Manihot esculenta]OAY60633.1 hypothetical protein MANES_01G127300v8 [Manihot esculenta]